MTGFAVEAIDSSATSLRFLLCPDDTAPVPDVIVGLDTAPGLSHVVGKGPLYRHQVHAVRQSLMKLLADDDAATTELFEAHSSLLRAALGAAYVVVENGIHNFELAAAMAEIETCLGAA